MTDCPHSIANHDDYYSWAGADFYPDEVLTNECDDHSARNYWLLPNGVGNQGFVIDRGCQEPFNTIILKNTHNGFYKDRSAFFCFFFCFFFFFSSHFSHTVLFIFFMTTLFRGTANFNVLVLTFEGQWESILHGRMEWHKDECNVPLDAFVLDQVRSERLVRFVAKTVYRFGGGLQFIDFVFDPDAMIPGTWSL